MRLSKAGFPFFFIYSSRILKYCDKEQTFFVLCHKRKIGGTNKKEGSYKEKGEPALLSRMIPLLM